MTAHIETLKLVEFTYSGMMFKGGVSKDGRSWVRSIDVERVIGDDYGAVRSFYRGKSEAAATAKRLGYTQEKFMHQGYHKPVMFMAPESVALYYRYKGERGNYQALALLQSSFAADIDHTLKEASGYNVTRQQQEDLRKQLRVDLLAAIMNDFESQRPPQEVSWHVKSHQFKGHPDLSEVEYRVACNVAYLRDKLAVWQSQIATAKGASMKRSINAYFRDNVDQIKAMIPDDVLEELGLMEV